MLNYKVTILDYKVTKRDFIQAFEMKNGNNMSSRFSRILFAFFYFFMVLIVIIVFIAVLTGRTQVNNITAFRYMSFIILMPFIYFSLRYYRARSKMIIPRNYVGIRSLKLDSYMLRTEYDNICETIVYSYIENIIFNKHIIVISSYIDILEIIPSSAFSSSQTREEFINELILNIEKAKTLKLGIKEDYNYPYYKYILKYSFSEESIVNPINIGVRELFKTRVIWSPVRVIFTAISLIFITYGLVSIFISRSNRIYGIGTLLLIIGVFINIDLISVLMPISKTIKELSKSNFYLGKEFTTINTILFGENGILIFKYEYTCKFNWSIVYSISKTNDFIIIILKNKSFISIPIETLNYRDVEDIDVEDIIEYINFYIKVKR